MTRASDPLCHFCNLTYDRCECAPALAEIRAGDGRTEIVASLIRDAIDAGSDDAADDAAARIMSYLLVEPRGCPTPGACSAALTETAASAIEAASAVETTEIGSTEGESAVVASSDETPND